MKISIMKIDDDWTKVRIKNTPEVILGAISAVTAAAVAVIEIIENVKINRD